MDTILFAAAEVEAAANSCRRFNSSRHHPPPAVTIPVAIPLPVVIALSRYSTYVRPPSDR